MESNIVRDFERLQVFGSYDLLRMDELVQDLSIALEDTSRLQKAKSTDNLAMACARRHQKKRRGKKRRSLPNGLWDYGISEGSESSLDEALKDYMENVAQHSDSDDLVMAHRMAAVAFPNNNVMALVESDSVTENFSPNRPHRRRRRYKRMAIDPEPSSNLDPARRRKYRRQRSKQQMDTSCSSPVPSTSKSDLSNFERMDQDTETSSGQDIKIGKRKRTHKQSGNSFDNDQENCDSMLSPISSSSLSSNESETGIVTFDEAREGDDEQSDFFHESGPSCGIPGIIPWWENTEKVDEDDDDDPNFEKILNGSFEQMTKATQRTFKYRLNRIMNTHGREIRAGRRKLKDKIPSYNMARFLQERQQWKDTMSKKYHTNYWLQTGSSNNSGDIKRRRKTPPPGSLPETVPVGGETEPISESNLGNKMLQNMGWTPGSGLGVDGSGIKTPIVAFLRPRRQGLGHDTLSDS